MLNPYIKTTTTYNEVVYYYRIRENSASTASTKDKVDKLINTCKEFYDASHNGIIDEVGAMRIVYDHIIPVMNYVAKLPRRQADLLISKLKEIHLFPLKRNKTVKLQCDSSIDFDNRILLRLKEISYTRIGYYGLRKWRYWLKIKRKVMSVLK